MKRLCSILVFIFICLSLMGQTIIYKDSATVEWSAVVLLGNGDPIPVGYTIEYELYLSAYPVVDPQNPAAHTYLGTTSNLTFPMVIDWDDHRSVGVRTVMTESDLVTKHYSAINWSYTNGAATPDPFLYVRSQSPQLPMGLRTQ